MKTEARIMILGDFNREVSLDYKGNKTNILLDDKVLIVISSNKVKRGGTVKALNKQSLVATRLNIFNRNDNKTVIYISDYYIDDIGNGCDELHLVKSKSGLGKKEEFIFFGETPIVEKDGFNAVYKNYENISVFYDIEDFNDFNKFVFNKISFNKRGHKRKYM